MIRVLALLLTVCASTASGQSWQPLPLPCDFGWDAELRLAPDGTPYLGYLGPGGNARVSCWDGQRWQTLGSPSCSTSWQSTLFFSHKGQPYYASRDYGAAGSFNVQRYQDGAWERLTLCGEENDYGEILVASVHDLAGVVLDAHPKWALDPGAPPSTAPAGNLGIAVLLVNDGYPSSDPNYPNYPADLRDEYPTVVMGRFGDWRYLGSRRFSETPASYLDLGWWEGRLWVVYSEAAESGRLTLKRYSPEAGDWVTAASVPGLGGGNTALTSAAGRLLVVTNTGGYLRAFSFAHGALVPLGGVFATNVHMGQQSWIQKVSCGFDADGRLYVGYRRADGRFAVSRATLDGVDATWTLFGESDAAAGDTRFVSMAVSANEGRVYVAYTDANERPVVVWRPVLD